ncbi:hypothetical protein RRG08_054662 [Elysia crispata]|uniref:Uncharacterized protein n=1 Tax=Elysia crispata TaxID=231223 RepID=A0AAE1B2E7_9GAST|nr:hypothetical protein RRG08_054662 [Elysia crispata]
MNRPKQGQQVRCTNFLLSSRRRVVKTGARWLEAKLPAITHLLPVGACKQKADKHWCSRRPSGYSVSGAALLLRLHHQECSSYTFIL